MESEDAVDKDGEKIGFSFNTPDNSYPLVFLKLVKETPQTEADSPGSSASESKTLAIHPQELTASPFFAALLQRWASNGLHGSGPSAVKVFEVACEDPEAASLAIQIIACGTVSNVTPSRPVLLHGVEQALSVLRACRYFLSDPGVRYCTVYLECSAWTPDEREEILVTFQEMELEMTEELGERLADQKSSRGSGLAEEIFKKVLDDALSLESGTMFCKVFPSKSDMDGSERPRVVFEEIATSGWLGLTSEVV